MSLSRPCRAAAAVLAAALLLVLAPSASADTASDESRVLSLIQGARSSVGAPGLRVDASLTSAARSWAAKMARDGTISHNVGIGSQVTASKLSENVGMGPSIDVVHQGFLNSSGHRANMVDTGVNAVGVGVAWSNGTVYVVQDYAQLASSPPPPPPPPPAPANRPPAVPTNITPANGTVLRTPATQAAARYADADGTAGKVYFAVVDERGAIVRQAWSPTVCSGCPASVSFAALPDGFYWLLTAGFDGTAASAVSPVSMFSVNRSAPRPPTRLTRAGNTASAVYSDPDGTAGWLNVFVVSERGALLHQGWTARVCSGCTATYSLPALGRGTFHVFAFGYDGLISPVIGPNSFAV